MEVTKQDKKHIDEQVRLVAMRCKMEATEYATLCEQYYYEKLIEQLQSYLQGSIMYQESIKNVYNK